MLSGFSRDEIKRNLLGSLEAALFLPALKERFGNSPREAFISFLIPILMFPLTIPIIMLDPLKGLADNSMNVVVMFYLLHTVLGWVLFFSCLYWILLRMKRHDYFFQFVIANNWLTVPTTLVFMPVIMLLVAQH